MKGRHLQRTLATFAVACCLAVPGPAPAQAATCSLHLPGASEATSASCLACHGAGGGGQAIQSCHPLDLDYAARQAATPGRALRPLEEVLGRGVNLPAGQVRCVTCHDGASPWAQHLALPVGSPAQVRVVPALPATYAGTPPKPTAGAAVSPKPLCLACHRLGRGRPRRGGRSPGGWCRG